VRLSDPRTPINLKQQGSQIFIDFAAPICRRTLQRRYDTPTSAPRSPASMPSASTATPAS
jgi:hypothetical protein